MVSNRKRIFLERIFDCKRWGSPTGHFGNHEATLHQERACRRSYGILLQGRKVGMPFELDLQHETLRYTGHYARPTLGLWGSGGVIIKGLLDALGQHGVTLQQIQVSGSLPNASETVVTAHVPRIGTVKFGFDKIKLDFSNFSPAFFEAMPSTITKLVAWIVKAVPDFKFASHRFYYFSHSLVKNATPQEVLKALNVREIKSAGISVGNGAIYNHTVPSRNWETQLLIDKSQQLAGGLYVSLDLVINAGEIDYGQVMVDGRRYLAEALAELDLVIPEAVVE